MSFAAATVSGGLPPTLGNDSPNQDWRHVPVKRESSFEAWVNTLPPSKNVEDRRGIREGENDLAIADATDVYAKRMDRIPTDENIKRADRSSTNLDEANLQKAGPRSRMIESVPLPRPRPGPRQPMIYK